MQANGKASNMKLQWGRSRLTAEMIPKSLRNHWRNIASMGPQSFDCGNHDWAKQAASLKSGFNGAAVV